LAGEWRTRYWWLPILLLLVLAAATSLTLFVISPVEDVLWRGVHDQGLLDDALFRWRLLCWVRVALWSGEWGLVVYYLWARVQGRKGRRSRPAAARPFADTTAVYATTRG